MRKSLKTRLLSAAYKAACAFAEKVFAFTESVREKKDGSYLDDLYDYRDALAQELREGEELAAALSLRNSRVQAELDRTERELRDGNTQAIRSTYTVADFDDLPAPQGVNEDEAPEGFKAVAATPDGGCTGCYFSPEVSCPHHEGILACTSASRGDQQDVVFQPR